MSDRTLGTFSVGTACSGGHFRRWFIVAAPWWPISFCTYHYQRNSEKQHSQRYILVYFCLAEPATMVLRCFCMPLACYWDICGSWWSGCYTVQWNTRSRWIAGFVYERCGKHEKWQISGRMLAEIFLTKQEFARQRNSCRPPLSEN